MSRFDRNPTNAAAKPPTEPAQLDPDHIDASNEGFKMLKSMGWTDRWKLAQEKTKALEEENAKLRAKLEEAAEEREARLDARL